MSITNEEMASRIKRGEADLLPMLWNQIRGLIYFHASRFYNHRRSRCDASEVTVDDLMQEGYFAFCYAVRSFDPDKEYPFAAYLRFPLKNYFVRATGGMRNTRFELQNHCASLDAPLSMDNEAAIVDTLPDKNSSAAFESVEDAMVNSQLRKALDNYLSMLPENVREIIKMRYYGGQTLQQIAKQIGVTPERIRQIELKGLRKLHSRINERQLILSEQDVIDSVCRMGGVQRFRDTGYSSVELAYERIEEMRAQGQLEPEQ